MGSVSASAFMYYCNSTRHDLFAFLERSNNSEISNSVLDLVKKQDDFLARMIGMGLQNTQSNNTQNSTITREHAQGSNAQDSSANRNRHTNSTIIPDVPDADRPRGNSETRGSIDNLSNTSELFQSIINNTNYIGRNDNVRNIIRTVTAQTILPALTSLFNQNTPPDSVVGLTQEEIDGVTTEICFNEIESPMNLECPISQEIFDENERVIVLECGHIYKKDSILQWFTQGTYCPLCRVPLTPRENRNISEPMTFHIGITVDEGE